MLQNMLYAQGAQSEGQNPYPRPEKKARPGEVYLPPEDDDDTEDESTLIPDEYFEE